MKRLTQAINPESGTINYSYDENSNLKTKLDARSITTTYEYDTLNRVKSRTYSAHAANTPAVTYKYDNQSLPTGAPTFTRGSSIGRLVAATYGGTSAGSYQGYDGLGRVSVSQQQTDSENYGFGYVYNLTSEMTSQTYPSGRVVATEYDTGGRIAGVKNQATGLYYAGATASDATNRIQYASHGAVSKMKLGNGKWEHTIFNNRLQPTEIGLGTSGTDSSLLKLEYGYGTDTSNNGNIRSQKITAPGLTLNQCYEYDSLNRLWTATERSGGTLCSGTQQWKQSFSYDRFANRTFDAANTTPPNVLSLPLNPTISQANNRFQAGQNYDYDSAGNLTSDPTTGVDGIMYDAENRQIEYTKTGQQPNSYYYDGDGRRIKKIDNSGTTVFVYNAGGQLIAEYTSGAPSGGGTSYLTSDHLGSTRVVMQSDGSVARHDFLPFGEEIQGIGGRTPALGYVSDNVRQKFTQKERDTESGLDYFLARYYSSAQGRFTSPDEFAGGPDEFWILGSGDSEKQALPYAEITNPQSLNKYQYGYNNPLRYIDPDGHQQMPPEWLIKLLLRYQQWKEGSKEYVRSVATPTSFESPDENSVPKPQFGPIDMDAGDIARKHFGALVVTTEITTSVIALIDPTGLAGVAKSVTRGDVEGTVIGMAGMAVGGGMSKVTFGEAKRLVGSWAKDPVSNTISSSVRYHFGKHGAEVGATDRWQYLRKAEAFSRNLKGAVRTYLEGGKMRYTKRGQYIILDENRKIVSYGAAN